VTSARRPPVERTPMPSTLPRPTTPHLAGQARRRPGANAATGSAGRSPLIFLPTRTMPRGATPRSDQPAHDTLPR
jgi:hypothetical protein